MEVTCLNALWLIVGVGLTLICQTGGTNLFEPLIELIVYLILAALYCIYDPGLRAVCDALQDGLHAEHRLLDAVLSLKNVAPGEQRSNEVDDLTDRHSQLAQERGHETGSVLDGLKNKIHRRLRVFDCSDNDGLDRTRDLRDSSFDGGHDETLSIR